MVYPTLEKLNQSIKKIANSEGPNEAEMIKVSMDGLRKLLIKNAILYLGNGRCTFEIRTKKTVSCEVCYVGSGVAGTTLLGDQIQRFLNNNGLLHNDEVHEVFDFLREAEVKLEYFE